MARGAWKGQGGKDSLHGTPILASGGPCPGVRGRVFRYTIRRVRSPPMICPSCKAPNDDLAEACFTCGRAVGPDAGVDHRRPLRDPEPPRQRRHGHGLQGPRPDARRDGRDQGPARRVREHGRDGAALPPRDQARPQGPHRNVCGIHEYGEDAGHPLHLDGVRRGHRPEAARARGGGCLPPRRRFDIAIQFADGLQAIHDVGHRPPRPQDRRTSCSTRAASCG